MRARIKASDELWFEADAETEEDLFKQVARVQEVFRHNCCGKCGSPNVKFVCRLDSSENDWLFKVTNLKVSLTPTCDSLQH